MKPNKYSDRKKYRQILGRVKSARLFMASIAIILSLCLFENCKAQDPTRFADQIAAFGEVDKESMPEKGKIVFLGSSSIRMWKEAEEKFKEYGVINRGFGGSQTSDAIHYFDELVLKYAPSKIVFYEGDNDIGAGKSPKQVLKDFKTFVKMTRKSLPDCEIGFVAIKPSVARWNLAKEMAVANALIEKYCSKKENLTYIDVWTGMLGEDGKPKPDIFLEDNLHMNEKGYAIWNEQVLPFLKK